LNVSASSGWPGTAIGSDGTARSAPSQALRAAHEVAHHTYDIREVAERFQGLGSHRG